MEHTVDLFDLCACGTCHWQDVPLVTFGDEWFAAQTVTRQVTAPPRFR